MKQNAQNFLAQMDLSYRIGEMWYRKWNPLTGKKEGEEYVMSGFCVTCSVRQYNLEFNAMERLNLLLDMNNISRAQFLAALAKATKRAAHEDLADFCHRDCVQRKDVIAALELL